MADYYNPKCVTDRLRRSWGYLRQGSFFLQWKRKLQKWLLCVWLICKMFASRTFFICFILGIENVSSLSESSSCRKIPDITLLRSKVKITIVSSANGSALFRNQEGLIRLPWISTSQLPHDISCRETSPYPVIHSLSPQLFWSGVEFFCPILEK